MTAQADFQQKLDLLPAAVCLTEERSGKLLFANRNMRALLRTVERKLLCDAQPGAFLRLPDGSHRMMTEHKFFHLGETLLLRSFVDVSDRYEEYMCLEEETQLKVLAGKGIREYNAMIDDVIVQKEVLKAKINIHADMGNVLLQTKRLLMEMRLHKAIPSHEENEALHKQWWSVIAFLRGRKRQEKTPDVSAQLKDAAKAAGVSLTIRGPLPKEQEDLRQFVRDASKKIMECARAGEKELVLTAG